MNIDIDQWRTWIYQAVERSQISVIKWLLSRDVANVNDKIRNGFTMLHLVRTAGKIVSNKHLHVP